jgi:hypothetical protein
MVLRNLAIALQLKPGGGGPALFGSAGKFGLRIGLPRRLRVSLTARRLVLSDVECGRFSYQIPKLLAASFMACASQQ